VALVHLAAGLGSVLFSTQGLLRANMVLYAHKGEICLLFASDEARKPGRSPKSETRGSG
jgi:hypothetical protein